MDKTQPPGAPDSRSPLALPPELRAYWEAIREGQAIPRRDRIDPRGIAGVLDRAFLIERVAPGIARFRLAGMRLAGLMGMDLRGMPVSTLIAPPDRDRFAAALEPVFALPSILDLQLEAERPFGQPALAARMQVLPLANRHDEPVLALGCLVQDREDIGRAPRRFAITGIARELKGIATPATTAAGFAEPVTAFRPAPGQPHLRLVHDADPPRRGP